MGERKIPGSCGYFANLRSGMFGYKRLSLNNLSIKIFCSLKERSLELFVWLPLIWVALITLVSRFFWGPWGRWPLHSEFHTPSMWPGAQLGTLPIDFRNPWGTSRYPFHVFAGKQDGVFKRMGYKRTTNTTSSSLGSAYNFLGPPPISRGLPSSLFKN